MTQPLQRRDATGDIEPILLQLIAPVDLDVGDDQLVHHRTEAVLEPGQFAQVGIGGGIALGAVDVAVPTNAQERLGMEFPPTLRMHQVAHGHDGEDTDGDALRVDVDTLRQFAASDQEDADGAAHRADHG